MKFNFVNYPEEARECDYEQTREFIIQQVSKNKNIIALYEYGTVKAIGLSDIDLIALLSEKIHQNGIQDLIFLRKVPQYVSKTLNGSILRSMSANHFRKIDLLGEIHTKILYGRPVIRDRLSKSTQHYVKVADVMDWLPERVLMLQIYSKCDLIPVKRLIGCLYSFKHSMNRLLGIMKSKRINWSDFSKRLEQLRQNWYNNEKMTNLEELSSLLGEGIKIGKELISSFNEYLIKTGYYSPSLDKKHSFFYIDSSKAFCFSSDNILKGISTLTIPRIWLTHLYQYSSGKGIISDLISKNLSIDTTTKIGTINPNLKEVLLDRITLCNDMAFFLKKRNLYNALYRFAHIKEVLHTEVY